MSRTKLRDAIAAEAARLMLRHKEHDFTAARKRAARWLSRRKLAAADMPSNAEIQSQIYALAGLFSNERQQAALYEIRTAALELMRLLEPFQPRLTGSAVDGPVLSGAVIEIACTVAETAAAAAPPAHAIRDVLAGAGFHPRVQAAADDEPPVIKLHHHLPCEIRIGGSPSEGLDAAAVSALLEQPLSSSHADDPGESEAAADEDDYHADAFAAFGMLLDGLAHVELNPQLHPEGNALYHSLQVFELGRAAHPYDEEFLLACLLHDVGLALNRRLGDAATLDVLRGLVSDRTLFLIEHRAAALEYLATGHVSRSLRRSEHFDDLVDLARCDIDGRVPGAPVPEIDEALDYIAGLSAAWDDV